LGLGYEVLKSVHPSVIYATIKGFGLSGPYAGFKCYDMVAQATGGVFSVTGEPDGPPMRAGPSLADTTSGMTLALGIVSAYVQRLRTGKGQLIEVSMQEAVLNLMRTRFSQREVTGDPVPRRGNRLVPPSDLYPCAPGGPNDYIIMHFVMARMYDAFAIAIGRPELTTDPRFATQAERRKHRDELWAEVAAWTRQRTKYEAMEILGAAGVPCGAVLDSGDILSDRHLRERGSITTMHHPVRGDWEFPAPPIRMSESRVEVRPSPLLGENTDEILRQELGITAHEGAPLHEKSVI
jgi:formyl-CoA transferase